MDYAFIWAMLIAFSILAYVVFDGGTLGIGISFPFLPNTEERDRAMNVVAPVWDGNETWLILGGAGLYAVFPLAYALILPALYAPITAMVTALIFRGVAFEFRWRTTERRWIWDWSFVFGSIMAAFCQGIILGTMLQGIPVEGRAYAGGWWDWLSPFSLTTGIAVVFGYALLGATWLIVRTEGELQQRAFMLAKRAGLATLAMIGAVSLWTPFLQPQFFDRWFAYPAVFFVAPVPIMVAIAAMGLFQGLRKKSDFKPYLSAVCLFVLCFVGLGISFYPYIVPPSVTIWDAAAPDSSLIFLLVGAVVLIPVILAYTAYSHWVFRGKLKEGEGYH